MQREVSLQSLFLVTRLMSRLHGEGGGDSGGDRPEGKVHRGQHVVHTHWVALWQWGSEGKPVNLKGGCLRVRDRVSATQFLIPSAVCLSRSVFWVSGKNVRAVGWGSFSFTVHSHSLESVDGGGQSRANGAHFLRKIPEAFLVAFFSVPSFGPLFLIPGALFSLCLFTWIWIYRLVPQFKT